MKYARKGSLLCALPLLLISTARAQIIGADPLDPEHLKSRIAELTPPDKGIPESEGALVEEQVSLRNEIDQLRGAMGRATDLSREIQALDKAKGAIAPLLARIAGADCTPAVERNFDAGIEVTQVMNSIAQTVFVNDLEEVSDPWVGAPKARDGCAAWKTFVGNNAQQSRLLAYFESLKARLTEAAKERADRKAQGVPLLDLLQRRKEAVDKQLATKSTQSSITNNLWSVLLIIGTFSLGTILAVKLFSPDIQTEWVASGQVIQFVTVMILLSVVMALGLAGILKENTLGTLLGGIAGYVLAQGVGRAAAREAARSSGPTGSPPDGTKTE